MTTAAGEDRDPTAVDPMAEAVGGGPGPDGSGGTDGSGGGSGPG